MATYNNVDYGIETLILDLNCKFLFSKFNLNLF